MIDSFKFKVPFATDDQLTELLKNISQENELLTINNIGSGLVRRLKKLYISVKPNKDIVISGSLSKYYYDNNHNTLDYYSLIDSLNTLENELGISLNEAFLHRIDISSILLTTYTPTTYLSSLLDCSYKTRFQTESGLYYLSDNEKIVVYDKKNKVNKDDGKQYLRYEYRLENRKKIKKQLKIERVVDLKSKEIFNRLVDFWYESYLSINKLGRKYDDKNIKCVRDFNKFVYSEGVQSFGGVSATLDLIGQLRKQGNITTKMAYKVKESVKGNFVANEICENELVIELDKAFMEEAYKLKLSDPDADN